ncbi:MAG TPA: ornithine cyclodeaminase family protein [Bryobacteraceae bacterium]|nr:ornithine cyclodeaminase family protein [Bryobacteraceae bacterium]
MIHIDEKTVRDHLPMDRAIALLEAAFDDWREGKAHNQPRRRMTLPTGAVLHSLAGFTESYFGTKVYATHRQHGAWFHFLLYEAATARPLALFEANWLGQIRTGAASGLATSRLARKGPATVAVLGAGFQARGQLEAVRAVRPVERALVWSRSPERAEHFAAEMNAEVVASPDVAVARANIVITATSSKDPLFAAESVQPGTHINAVGSNAPNRRELPSALLSIADAIVADSVEQCRLEAGDLLLGLDEAGWSRVEELRDGRIRRNDSEITVFKSVGLGLEDVAVAAWVYESLRRP